MLAWVEHEGGWVAGRYAVRAVRPGAWDLLVAGRRRDSYRRASSARAAADRLESVRRRSVGIFVRAAAAVLLIGLIVVGARYPLEPDPARRPSVALAAQMDTAYHAVLAGGSIEAADRPGLRAAVVTVPYGDDLMMLTGEAAGRCYALYWNERRGPVARGLVPGLACEPSAALAQSAHNVYHSQTPPVAGHLPDLAGSFDWDHVLPAPERLRPWLIPTGVLLGAAALWLLVGASRVALGVDRPATG